MKQEIYRISVGFKDNEIPDIGDGRVVPERKKMRKPNEGRSGKKAPRKSDKRPRSPDEEDLAQYKRAPKIAHTEPDKHVELRKIIKEQYGF